MTEQRAAYHAPALPGERTAAIVKIIGNYQDVEELTRYIRARYVVLTEVTRQAGDDVQCTLSLVPVEAGAEGCDWAVRVE